MNDYSIINLNQFSWQLNIAIFGGIFSVFCLMYNTEYIFYGLTTFAFGVTAHVVYKLFEWIFRKEGENHPYYLVMHIANLVQVLIWLTLANRHYISSIIK